MTWRRIAVLAALAAVVSTAVASQGQAGGGIPIMSCGQVVTQNAFLTGDLNCVGLSGVVVGADGITIDLKGFALRGDSSAGHYGIDDNGHDRVTIKNGALRKFEYGVNAYNGADRISVSNVVAARNVVDGIFISGALARIRSSTASGSGQYGIVVVGDAAVVDRNRANANGFAVGDLGISVSGYTTPPVGKNVALGNAEPDECSPLSLC